MAFDLDDQFSRMFRQVLAEHRSSLAGLQHLRVASLCAGLDVCHLALNRILKAAQPHACLVWTCCLMLCEML